MNIIVSFSGRKDGNCDTIAKYISAKDDLILFMRGISTQPCANCDYECMSGRCKWRGDGIYSFFEKMSQADRIFFIIPMYCGNAKEYPDFLNFFARQYPFENAERHILGLERHKYNQKMKDLLLDEEDVKVKLNGFINR